MQGQGYDKFFKQARKANAQSAGSPARAARPQPEPITKFKIASTDRSQSPEEQVKKIMAARLKERKRAIAAKRRPFPKGPLVAVLVACMAGGAGVAYPDAYDWALKRVEIGVYGRALAADETAKKEEKKDAKTADAEKAADAKTGGEAKSAANTGAAKADAVPDTRGWTPEEMSFFNKLGERKRELDLRETELSKLEEELQKQKVELDAKIKQLEATRTQIAQTLKGRVDNDQAKVTKLVDVYSGMKPAQAAKVMETINEDLAVLVLDRMKKKSAADILNVMNADKAQRLSEMLAGYKRN